MASDMFLDLGDTIKGESKDKVYEGKIDILAWNWGMSQSGTFHEGGGGGAGKVRIQDLNITKNVDTATANLMLYCATGKHFGEGKLVCRKAGGEQLEYLVIKMKKIMVTNTSTGGTPGEDQLTENITLNFAEVAVEYTEQMEDGTGGAAVTFGWNIEQNVEM